MRCNRCGNTISSTGSPSWTTADREAFHRELRCTPMRNGYIDLTGWDPQGPPETRDVLTKT